MNVEFLFYRIVRGYRGMHFTEKQVDRIVISGINTRTSNKQEDDPEIAQIPNLWRRFYEEELPKIIPNQTSNFAIYGVYSQFDTGAGGDFTFTAGVEIRNDLTENMAFPVVVIESGKYLEFNVKGPMPDSILNKWKDIWEFFKKNADYKRAYKTDFDVYKSQEEADIYVSIKD